MLKNLGNIVKINLISCTFVMSASLHQLRIYNNIFFKLVDFGILLKSIGLM